MIFKTPYEYEVHFGRFARQYIVREQRPGVLFDTQLDCRPGLASPNPFPVLSLICTPPCVVYSCLPRLAAVNPKTSYQNDVSSLGAYLMQLWEWEPTTGESSTPMPIRPASLSIDDSETPYPPDKMASSPFANSRMHAPKRSANDSSTSHRKQPRIEVVSLPRTPRSRIDFVEGMQTSQKSDQEVKNLVLHWCEAVVPGGDNGWSIPADWEDDSNISTSVGKSANDALFLARCIDAQTLLRFQVFKQFE